MKLRSILRPCLLALALAPVVAACEPGTGSAAAALGGTYAGTAGNASYTFVIPETRNTPFAVTGTVTENGATEALRGTGARAGDEVTLELMRGRDGVEDVFGFSGTVDRAGDQITLTRAGHQLVLRRD
ncbi:MAG TPA: hypothetical protein VF625_13535 [Longimicrobium sp.]